MHPIFAPPAQTVPIPILFATRSTCQAILTALPEPARRFAAASGFLGKPDQYLVIPDAAGAPAHVLFGLEEASAKSRDLFRPGRLPALLPAGTYRFASPPHDEQPPCECPCP